jgi:hypothetical protein
MAAGLRRTYGHRSAGRASFAWARCARFLGVRFTSQFARGQATNAGDASW